MQGLNVFLKNFKGIIDRVMGTDIQKVSRVLGQNYHCYACFYSFLRD